MQIELFLSWRRCTICEFWFKSRDFNLIDKQRNGGPQKCDDDLNAKRAYKTDNFLTLIRDAKHPKKENGFHMNLLKPTKVNEWQRVFLLSISNVESLSCGTSLQATRNGFSMLI